MSIETVCPHCGAEFDTRHEDCPNCTIDVLLREKEYPFHQYPAKGYRLFEVYGEKFAVTRTGHVKANAPKWRVSHVETGAWVPESEAQSKIQAIEKARHVLNSIGQERFMASLKKVKDKISTAPNESNP